MSEKARSMMLSDFIINIVFERGLSLNRKILVTHGFLRMTAALLK